MESPFYDAAGEFQCALSVMGNADLLPYEQYVIIRRLFLVHAEASRLRG